MFQQDMVKNLKNKVDLKDIEPAVFEVLLKYIYTGQVKILNHMVPDLLDSAFKVGLNDFLHNILEFLLLIRATPS